MRFAAAIPLLLLAACSCWIDPDKGPLRCARDGVCPPGSACLAGVCQAHPTGEIFLAWSRPTTNGDGSALRDLRSHKIYWGMQAGAYDRTIDLFADTVAPGMLEHTVTGLAAGATYYFAVAAVDSESHEGPLSSEVSAVARAPAADVEPAWTDSIVALPYTIGTSGDYRLGADLVHGAGDAITIASDGVNLYGGNGFWGDPPDGTTMTFAEAGPGNSVVLQGRRSNVNVYGFHFVRGADVGPARSSAVSAPFGLGAGVRVHHNTFTLAGNYTVGIGSTDFGDARIYGNTTVLSNASVDLAFVEGSSSSSFKVYDNAITLRGTSGLGVGVFASVRNGEFYANTITIEADVDRGFVAAGFTGDDNDYFHDNDVTIAANRGWGFTMDGASEWLLLHNRVTLHESAPGALPDTSRAVRIRTGSHHHMIGYNVINASGDHDARAVSVGDDPAAGVAPRDLWIYGNTLISEDVALEFFGASTGVYSWNNTYDGGGGWAIAINTAGNGPVYFDYDGAAAASGLAVSKPTGFAVNWTSCDSFGPAQVSGETAGITFMNAPCPYPVSDVPSAPAGLTAR